MLIISKDSFSIFYEIIILSAHLYYYNLYLFIMRKVNTRYLKITETHAPHVICTKIYC